MFIIQQDVFNKYKKIFPSDEYDKLIILRDKCWESGRNSDAKELCDKIKDNYNNYVDKQRAI